MNQAEYDAALELAAAPGRYAVAQYARLLKEYDDAHPEDTARVKQFWVDCAALTREEQLRLLGDMHNCVVTGTVYRADVTRVDGERMSPSECDWVKGNKHLWDVDQAGK